MARVKKNKAPAVFGQRAAEVVGDVVEQTVRELAQSEHPAAEPIDYAAARPEVTRRARQVALAQPEVQELVTPKVWWQSVAVWASLLGIAASIAGLFGVAITAEDIARWSVILPELAALVVTLCTSIGSLIGRFRANRAVALRSPPAMVDPEGIGA